MSQTETARKRRATKTAAIIRTQQMRNPDLPRLLVQCSNKNIRAQVLFYDPHTRQTTVLAHAATDEKEIKSKLNDEKIHSGSMKAAEVIGQVIAERAMSKKQGLLPKVAFDRRGKRYHGAVKVLADAARKAGLEF